MYWQVQLALLHGKTMALKSYYDEDEEGMKVLVTEAVFLHSLR